MKKLTFTFSVLLLAIISVYSQTTVVDFETLPYEQGGWNGVGEVISNTITDGINSSESACEYTIPADAAWGNCAWVVFEDVIEYATMDSIQFMVLAPSATQMYVKLENNTIEGETAAEAYATPIESSEWQLVTLKFSGLSDEDSINAQIDKIAIFFNVNDGDGGEEWVYDNIMVFPGDTLSGVSQPRVNLNYSVYPNPVRDYVTITSDAQSVEIYSISGALLKKEVIVAQTQQLSMMDYAKGIYLVKVINKNNQAQTFKVTKE